MFNDQSGRTANIDMDSTEQTDTDREGRRKDLKVIINKNSVSAFQKPSQLKGGILKSNSPVRTPGTAQSKGNKKQKSSKNLLASMSHQSLVGSFDADKSKIDKSKFLPSQSHRLHESNLMKQKMKLIKSHESKFVHQAFLKQIQNQNFNNSLLNNKMNHQIYKHNKQIASNSFNRQRGGSVSDPKFQSIIQ